MKSKRLLVALQATFLTLSAASVSAEPLTNDQITALDPTTIGAQPATDFAELTAEQAALFTPEVVAGLTAEQLAAIPVEAYVGFTADQLAKVTVEASVGLTAEQVAKLSEDQLGGLTEEVVGSLSDDQKAQLTDAQKAVLAPPPATTPDPTATTDPGTTDPATTTDPTDPAATTDPTDPTATTDPATTDPAATTDPTDPTATTDPATTDPAATTDPTTTADPATTDPATTTDSTATDDQVATTDDSTATDDSDDDGDDDGDDDDDSDDDGEEGSGIDTTSLTAETIAELTVEEIGSLTAEELAEIPVEAIKGLTKELIAAISIKAVVGFTTEQLANVAPEAMEGFTSEQSAEMTEEQLTAVTDTAVKEVALGEAEPEDIEGALAVLDDEANPLHALIKMRLFLSIDIGKLEVKFEGKHGKKRFSKEFAEALADFYKGFLPKGWKVSVKEKHGMFYVKIKVKKHHHHHFKFALIKFVNVGFVPAIDFEADVEEGETEEEVAEQVAELPAEAAGALTEEQLTEEIPEKAVETLKETNESATIKIFLNINLSNEIALLKFLPKGWELNAETKKVSVPAEAVKQLPVESLTPSSVAALEPEVASNFSEEQVSKLPAPAVAAMPPEMFLKIQLPALKGFKAVQLSAISVNVLALFSVEMMAMINPVEIVIGFKPDQLNGIGRPKMTELFTVEQINAIMGSTPVVDDPTLDDDTTDDTTDDGDDTTDDDTTDDGDDTTDDDTTDDGDDTTDDDTTDDGDDTTDDDTTDDGDDTTDDDTTDDGDDTTDDGDDQPVEVVDDSGNITLPKIEPELSDKVTFPMVANLAIEITFNGKLIEGGILGLLGQTLLGLGFGDFSTFIQEQGIMLVTGTGKAEGISFAFMPPKDGNIQPAAEDSEAGLDVDEDGNYVVNTDEGLAVTVESAPKDVVAIAEAVDGEVAVAEDGTTTISGNIQTAEEGAEAPAEIAGVFDPMVVPAEEGAEPGVTITGEPGVDETATVVYPDGSAQTMFPAVEDKASLEEAVEEVVPDLALKYINGVIHFTIEGYQMLAVPEFTVSIVTEKPAKSVLRILKPGKLVEYINKHGKRQVLHIQIVGIPDETPVEEAPVEEPEAPVEEPTAEVPADETVPEGNMTEVGADDTVEPEVTDPATIAEGEPTPGEATEPAEGEVPPAMPPLDDSTAAPGDGEVPATEPTSEVTEPVEGEVEATAEPTNVEVVR